jgi:FkbM family methyltransferase
MRQRARILDAVAASEAQNERDDLALPAGAPDAVLGRNDHGLYCVPRSSLHRPVAQTILDARVWEPSTLDLLRGVRSDGDVVHAGTFFGDFIPALAQSRAAGAHVWAFEPNRENYECARVTIELNSLENVTLTHAGLDESSGTALLATSDRLGLPAGGRSRLIDDGARERWSESEEVKLVAVDDVVSSDRDVAVIQLDVEGHEQQALTGAMRTIARCRPLIVLESPPRDRWIAEHLAPLGYLVAGTVDENTILRQG